MSFLDQCIEFALCTQDYPEDVVDYWLIWFTEIVRPFIVFTVDEVAFTYMYSYCIVLDCYVREDGYCFPACALYKDIIYYTNEIKQDWITSFSNNTWMAKDCKNLLISTHNRDLITLSKNLKELRQHTGSSNYILLHKCCINLVIFENACDNFIKTISN